MSSRKSVDTSASKPPTFFIDRCLGTEKVAQALKAKGLLVKVHDDHFSQGAQDEAWLPEVGRRDWIVLTKDARIAKRLTECLAVASANIKMFVLTSQSLSGEEMANSFVTALPGILKFLQHNNAPFIAKVHKNGRVSPWKTEKDLIKELKHYTSES